MPQMSPLNWMMLYIYMLLILMIINVILSYLYLLKKSKDKLIIYNKKIYKWMW